MKKYKSPIRKMSLFILAVVMVVVPILGIACGDKAIEADFSATPTSGVAPITVQFTDQSTGDAIAWEWDLDGNGTVDSVEQNPSFTYETAGMHTVSLTVKGAAGNSTKTKTNYINSSAYVYQKMNLRLTNPYPATDPNGIAAEKFKELIELYTNGNVTVTNYHNGSLYQMGETFEALKTGAVDMAMMHPALLRAVNRNLDAVGSLRGYVESFAHGHAVIADSWVRQFILNKYAEYDVRFLGYVEAFLFSGYFSTNVDIRDFADIAGTKFYWARSGPPDPIEAMFGVIPVNVTQSDLPIALSNGTVNVAVYPATSAWESGLYKMFSYYYASTTFAPSSIQMSLQTWNKMTPELQDLIDKTIMPEVQTYTLSKVVEIHKRAMLGLKLNLKNVSIVSQSRLKEVYQLVSTRADFLTIKALMDPDLMSHIDALRPATAVMDPEVVDIAAFAGITIPK